MLPGELKLVKKCTKIIFWSQYLSSMTYVLMEYYTETDSFGHHIFLIVFPATELCESVTMVQDWHLSHCNNLYYNLSGVLIGIPTVAG